MKQKRLFVALPLPDAIKDQLHEWTQHWRQELSFQKWVHQDDVHLTLKFLGDTIEDNIGSIADQLEAIVAAFPAFTLRFDGLGTFGPPVAPSILWAGVKGDLTALHRIQQSIETSFEPLGFEQEKRPFRPHLTLARRYMGLTKLNRSTLSDYAQQFAFIDVSWLVERIVLFESRLGERPLYHEVAQFRLRG